MFECPCLERKNKHGEHLPICFTGTRVEARSSSFTIQINAGKDCLLLIDGCVVPHKLASFYVVPHKLASLETMI